MPDGKNSELNCVDVLIKHKQGTNEGRDIFLVVNEPGFNPGQIEELRDNFKGVGGIHVVDLHDLKYGLCWKEIDQGRKVSGKDIGIRDYFHDMHSKERTLQLRLIPSGILQLIVCYMSKRDLKWKKE